MENIWVKGQLHPCGTAFAWPDRKREGFGKTGYAVGLCPSFVAAPPGEVRIRRVEPDDWGSLREIRLRALETEPWAFGSTLLRERGFSESQWRGRIARNSADSPDATWAAVDSADGFLGIVAAARVDGVFNIFAMWVAPERRRQGIAGRLLDAALCWIERIAPGSSVQLEVNPRAVAAVRLYESRGFRVTGKSTVVDHTPSERVQEMIRPG
jgi:ribosomal protein S18 acetylase RimI-like enzyme